MLTRKQVSNQEYEEAYKNKDNRKVIQSVVAKYYKSLDRDDLESAGMTALLRCLEYHDPSYNQKFTTSLWRFTDWECKRILRKKSGKPQHKQLSTIEYDIPQKILISDDNKFVQECVEQLQDSEKNILSMYYYDGRTMEEIGRINGYSKETARQRINKSLKRLEDIVNREKAI